MIGPANPNRLHLWTGWFDPHGTAGGPANTDFHVLGQSGAVLEDLPGTPRSETDVSWRIYQEDNYDDNALAWFRRFADAPKSSPLCEERDGEEARGLDWWRLPRRVREPHISAWRRRTVGDLASAFRFDRQPARYPRDNRLRYPATTADLLQAQVRDNPAPPVPTGPQSMPR